MLTWKRIQIGLIHAAVAITLVPINSTLNRIMIEDLGIPATLVVLLFSLPYLISFIQIAIGSFSDSHPVMGYRRSPYIMIGLLLCVAGLLMSTRVALTISENFWVGLGLGLLTYGAWGMGFNFASVAYFSLASEITGEKGRSKTTAIMFFIMIVSIIISSAGLSRMLQPFSDQALQRSFVIFAMVALVMGLVGLIGLEKRTMMAKTDQRYSLRSIIGEIISNKQTTLFFIYLILMLAAILGQDVLLEPFAARAFDLPVSATTRITTIWGTCYLLSLVITGMLEGKVAKIVVARMASIGAILAFLLIAASGLMSQLSIFYAGVVMLGFATGPATVANLSLMLDMTVPGKVGLFIGAWGTASAFARFLGSFSTAVVRDLINQFPEMAVTGYVLAFAIQVLFLGVSLVILRRINVEAFHKRSSEPLTEASVIRLAAVDGEV